MRIDDVRNELRLVRDYYLSLEVGLRDTSKFRDLVDKYTFAARHLKPCLYQLYVDLYECGFSQRYEAVLRHWSNSYVYKLHHQLVLAFYSYFGGNDGKSISNV